MSTVVNVRKKYLTEKGYQDFEDWLNQKNHLYIGRNMSFYVKGTFESKWCNPFPAKKYGIDECLKLYKEYMLKNKDLLNQLDELDGKELGCWCVDDKNNKCHGNILIELLKLKKENKLEL